jgi:hypothetical protein
MEGWIPIARQAARTLPSSAAIAKTRGRNRYSRSSCITAMPPRSLTWWSGRRMRRRLRKRGCAQASLQLGDRTSKGLGSRRTGPSSAVAPMMTATPARAAFCVRTPNFTPDGPHRPGKTLVGTAVGRHLLARRRSLQPPAQRSRRVTGPLSETGPSATAGAPSLPTLNHASKTRVRNQRRATTGVSGL